MSAIVPECKRLTASSATEASHFAALQTECSTMSSAWWTFHQLGTNDFALTQFPVTTQRIRIRLDTVIKVTVDPANTSAANAAWTPSASVSAERNALSALTTNIGLRSNTVFYPDAITFLIQNDASPNPTFYVTGFHAGLIFVPDNGNDTADGMTGHGILTGQPRFASSSVNNAWTSSSTTQNNTLRLATTTWSTSALVQQAQTATPGQGGGGTVASKLRVTPLRLQHDRSSGISIGNTRWFRQRETNTACFTRRDADTGDQSWMTVAYSTSTEPLVCLWDKNVTP